MNFPDFFDEEEDADTSSEGPIRFHMEDVTLTLPFTAESLSSWLEDVIQSEGKTLVGLDFIYCSDEYLLEVNKEYLNHDYYTDVITFPYQNEAVEGDVFISVDRVKENAAAESVDFSHELCRVMVHGVLHLCGYEDHTPELKAQMRGQENHYLGLLNFGGG
jgi:rRNA maturation RNase YbeY